MKTLSIFLDSGSDTRALADAIAGIVGTAFTKRELDSGTTYRTIAFSTEFLLYGDHGMEDDSGILFSAQTHELQCIPLRPGAEDPEFFPLYESVVLFLAARISREASSRCLVVKNLQEPVAEYHSGRRL